MLGPRSGAGTAGLRAVPEIMVPVNALAPDSQRREIRKVFLILAMLSHFSSVRLCDPIDGSPPGSPVPGILQARTLE